jgi:hypothetical protein
MLASSIRPRADRPVGSLATGSSTAPLWPVGWLVLVLARLLGGDPTRECDRASIRAYQAMLRAVCDDWLRNATCPIPRLSTGPSRCPHHLGRNRGCVRSARARCGALAGSLNYRHAAHLWLGKGVLVSHVPPTQSRVGRCLCMCRGVHGYRSGRPQPQADRRWTEGVAVAGGAVVHQVHGGDGRGDVGHRSCGQSHRSQTHAPVGTTGDQRRCRPRRYVRYRAGNRWVAGTVGVGQRIICRHRAGHHSQLGTWIGGPGDRAL